MSEEKGPILLADIERLADVETPELVRTIEALLEQAPGGGGPYDDYEDEDDDYYDEDNPRPVREAPPPDAVTLKTLREQLKQASKRFDKAERRTQAHEAWKRYLGQKRDYIAPQIKLAELIEKLYEKKTGPARRALIEIARKAPLVYGIWGGLKRVYKKVEADQDAEMFGVLGARFDNAQSEYSDRDVQRGTLVYLQRRVWRYLRLLGKASPELYPTFAVEVLRSYPINASGSSTIASKIEHHSSQKWGAPKGLPRDKKFRVPYLDAWKRSPDPLMLLLETCQADFAARFAILGLKELFPDTLREVTPEWLSRLAFRPLASAHTFLVETLEGSPEYHQGKLKSVGLHDAVLQLLVSPDKKARKYAIEYARGHATDLSTEKLIELLGKEDDYDDTAKLAATMLQGRGARKLGIEIVGRLVQYDATSKWAKAALDSDFEKKEITETFLADMLLSNVEARVNWAETYIDKKLGAATISLAFWMRVLDDPRIEDDSEAVADWVATRIAKHIPVSAAPADWVLKALARDDIEYEIANWLEKADALPSGMDIERIKGLVFDPQRREIAFKLLGNKKLVSPGDVGLGWLLALARRADPTLHEWAHRYLLQHMKPENFADGKADAEAGVARLFSLALGAREPEAVRAFAQTFLRCHHPKIGKEQPESKQFNIKPQVHRDEYTMDRVWPALFDQRADVRRFAVTITRIELRHWKAQSRVYELAESSAKEVRKIAYDALIQAGEAYADPDFALKPEELDAAQIFSMTESRSRSSRDIAIELIRKHYARIGGAERLGWLMQSADREVRFFAVRLLWEKHRPRGIPAEWKPSKGRIDNAGPFKDAEALRDLLRRLLFTIPPGRSMEQLEGARTKKLPASVAKRSLVEIVRDLAVEDASFALLVAPVFAAQTGSKAKGEWHACLSALMTLRSVHGIAIEGLEGLAG